MASADDELARFAPPSDGSDTARADGSAITSPAATTTSRPSKVEPTSTASRFVPGNSSPQPAPQHIADEEDPRTHTTDSQRDYHAQPDSIEGRPSWEQYRVSSRDQRERRATRIRAMNERAHIAIEHDRRVNQYRTCRAILIAFWSVFLICYLIGAIANSTTGTSAALGTIMWFGTMTGAAAAFVSWHLVRHFHPGPRPNPSLPDDTPRHHGLRAPASPAWDRRPRTVNSNEIDGTTDTPADAD